MIRLGEGKPSMNAGRRKRLLREVIGGYKVVLTRKIKKACI